MIKVNEYPGPEVEARLVIKVMTEFEDAESDSSTLC